MSRSEELRGVAQRIAAGLPPDVLEVVVTGSVSRGMADETSDIELLVVTPEQLSLADAFALARCAGLEQLDTWGAQDVPVRRVSGRFERVPIELIFWSRAVAERSIDSIFGGPVSGSADALVHGLPLRTSGLLAHWQARLADYPMELRRAHIEDAALPWGGFHAEGLLTLGRPGEAAARAEWIADGIARLVRIVFAVNGVWPPTLKRLAVRSAPLGVQPERFAERVEHVVVRQDLLGLTELQLDAVNLAPDGANVLRARRWLAAGVAVLRR